MARKTHKLEISFFLIIFSRRHSCPPEQRVRKLEGEEEEKLYESLNPMTNDMQSDSDEMTPEDGKCSKKYFNFIHKIFKVYTYFVFSYIRVKILVHTFYTEIVT